jgi:hypothetical protein
MAIARRGSPLKHRVKSAGQPTRDVLLRGT